MAQVQYADSLVKEYLLWRGFSSCLKSLDAELRNEKDKGLRGDKIMEEINTLVNNNDLQALKDLWLHLETNLFNKLDHSFASAIKKLEYGLFKLYLITAYSNNKIEKVSEFFQKYSTELHTQNEWKDWFYLPFCKNPEECSTFAIYFTKQWQDTFLISLHNFLATIYQCVPQSTLTKLENEFILLKKLQEENCALRSRIAELSTFQQTSAMNNATTTINLPESSKRNKSARPYSTVQSLNDITPVDISPPGHIIDDFYIIASENVNVNQITDYQSRGLRSLIKNMSSGNSPVMGRKETVDRSKRRSESVGRNWI